MGCTNSTPRKTQKPVQVRRRAASPQPAAPVEDVEPIATVPSTAAPSPTMPDPYEDAIKPTQSIINEPSRRVERQKSLVRSFGDRCAYPAAAVHDRRDERFLNACSSGKVISDDNIFSCFDDGLLFRIRRGNEWFFYNDTQTYEMHLRLVFSTEVETRPGNNHVTTVGRSKNRRVSMRPPKVEEEEKKIESDEESSSSSNNGSSAGTEDWDDIYYDDEKKELEELIAYDGSLSHDVEAVTYEVVVYPGEFVLALYGKAKKNQYRIKATAVPLPTPKYREIALSNGYAAVAKEAKNTYIDEELKSAIQRGAFSTPVSTEWGIVTAAGDAPNAPLSLLPTTSAARDGLSPNLLRDKWLVEAMAILYRRPNFLLPVLLNDNSRFAANGVVPEEATAAWEKGMFPLQLVVNGTWKTVTVDRIIPMIGGSPAFARHFNAPREVWPCILEKAFAKIAGSYDALQKPQERVPVLAALSDMTGCPVEFYQRWLNGNTLGTKVHKSATKVSIKVEDGEAQELYDRVQYAVGEEYLPVFVTPRSTTGPHTLQMLDAVRLPPNASFIVVDVGEFSREEQGHEDPSPILLFKMRPVLPGINMEKRLWTGPWGERTLEWHIHATIAETCGVNKLGESIESGDEDSFWIEVCDVMKYFAAGGVCHTRRWCYDCRVSGAFKPNSVPSMVMEVNVNHTVDVVLMLTQPTPEASTTKDNNNNNEAASGYTPIMLSVSHSKGGKAQEIDKCSSSQGVHHESAKAQYFADKSVSMTYRFEPAHNPYYIIPRCKPQEGAKKEERPYVLTMLTDFPIGDEIKAEFRALPDNLPVFKDDSAYSFEVETTYPKKYPLQLFRAGDSHPKNMTAEGLPKSDW